MPFGPLEIILVLVVVLLVFGAKKLPEIGKGLGSGMREFRDGVSGRDEEAPRRRSASSEPASLQKAPQDDPAAAGAAAATGSAPQAGVAEETVTAEPVAEGERGTSSPA